MVTAEDVRTRVQEMLPASGYNQASLCRQLERTYGIVVSPAEFSKFRKGTLRTRKADRCLLWAVELMTADARRKSRERR